MTLELRCWRWPKRTAQIAIVFVVLIVGGVVAAWHPLNYIVRSLVPVMVAYVCPSCYGLESCTSKLLVEAAMPPEDKARLRDTVAKAAEQVAAFYGSFDRQPTVMACESDACYHRLGGQGERAAAIGTMIIRLSARGLNQTIVAHEFSHLEFNARVGINRLVTGAVPAWFDEGLAVVVSNDARYLGPGVTSEERCLAEPKSELPSNPFQWKTRTSGEPATESEKSHSIYAQAACRVMRWMDANGGPKGFQAAMRQVADGTRRLP
jgi:hypothetical protein